ncbi:SpoIIE family protein phosphatase [Anaeroselena agilis]|uniref:SpoIIE family protein phosphatase n=1 Tax=Anaeroselena agilis TaxID=3063788 RepID=A0ABU3P170_9FIRM|nr:SpoIIE family protein phosphatase [Selenomonadales bacterium 4137-cl]
MPKGTVVTISGGTAAAEPVGRAGGTRWTGLVAWVLASLVRPTVLPFNILAFLLGRVSIVGELAPFGLAFCAATVLTARGRAPAAAVAALMGMLSVGRFLEAGLYLFVMLAYGKLADRLSRQERKLQAAPLYVFAAVVFGGGLVVLWHQAPLYSLLLVVFDAALCVVLTYIFAAAMPLVDGRSGRAAGSEAVMCLVVMLAAAAAGVGDATVAGFSIRNMASSLVIMLLAFAGGAGLGAAAGVAVGLVAGLADGGAVAMVGLYGVAGLLAAAFRSLGKLAVIAGFLLGGMIAVLEFAQTADIAKVLAEGAVAAAAFAAVPVEWLRIWRRGLKEKAAEDRSEPPVREAGAKLARVADIFTGLAGVLGRRAAQNGAMVREEELNRLLAAAGDKVCGPCRRRAACWEYDRQRTVEALEAALAGADKARLTSADLPAPLKERCEHGRELAEAVNYAAERNRALCFWDKKAAEARLLTAEQLRAVGAIVRDLAGEVNGGGAAGATAATLPARAGDGDEGRRETGRCRVTTGLAFAAKEKVSGDTAAVLPLPDGKAALVLSDGMGTGSRAAGDSAATVRFLERLLTAGFAVDVAVRTVNSLLLLKLPEESFTTVDMAVIDTAAGEAEFLKVGAAPSFVKRVREVATVKSSSLPVGIMQQVEIEPVRWLLAPGDVIVMVSDGVVEAPNRGAGKEAWVVNFLRRLPDCDPQEMAERILHEAEALAGPCRRDDMTVLVARVTGDPGLGSKA